MKMSKSLTPAEYEAALRANPRFREAPKSGRGYIIGAALPPRATRTGGDEERPEHGPPEDGRN